MHDFGGLVTETMDAEQRTRLPVKQQLEHAGLLAGDLRARQVAEKRLADFVGNLLRRQFLLGVSHRTDTGNGVNAGWHIGNALVLAATQAGRTETSLVISGAGQ